MFSPSSLELFHELLMSGQLPVSDPDFLEQAKRVELAKNELAAALKALQPQ